MGKKTFVGNVINEVLSVLGLGGHYVTTSDIDIQNLLTPDAAYQSHRKAALFAANGDLQVYSDVMLQSIRQYRRKYSASTVSNLGYAPTTNALVSTFDSNSVLSYIQTAVNNAAVSITRLKEGGATIDRVAYFELQNEPGWDNFTSTLTFNGEAYLYQGAVKTNSTTIEVSLRRAYAESIAENLTANYAYDSLAGTVLIDAVLYNVGEINGNLYGDPVQYRTTMTLVSDGVTTVDVFTDVEDITREVSSDTYDTETMQVEYLTAEVNKYYIYLEDLDTVPGYLRTTTSLDFTPIITVKEENEILDQEDKNLQKMMRNVGVDPESIYPSLDQEQLNSAYLIYGVPFDTTNQACIKVMYETFNLQPANQGNTVITITNLDMRYEYEYTRTESVGSIGSVGTYTKSIVEEGASWNMYLRKQVTTEEYITIKVIGMLLTYTISGETNMANMNAGGDEARLLIPISVLNSLKTREYYDVYEESLALLSYAEQTTYVEWYETEFFQFVMKILGVILIVVGIVTGNAALIKAGVTMLVVQAVYMAIDWAQRHGYIDAKTAAVLKAITTVVAALQGNPNMDNAVYTSISLSTSAVSLLTSYKMQEAQMDYDEWMEHYDSASEKMEITRKEYQDAYDSIGMVASVQYFREDLAEQRQISSGAYMTLAQSTVYSATIDSITDPITNLGEVRHTVSPPKMEIGTLYT